jgi:hypothetical protein
VGTLLPKFRTLGTGISRSLALRACVWRHGVDVTCCHGARRPLASETYSLIIVIDHATIRSKYCATGRQTHWRRAVVEEVSTMTGSSQNNAVVQSMARHGQRSYPQKKNPAGNLSPEAGRCTPTILRAIPTFTVQPCPVTGRGFALCLSHQAESNSYYLSSYLWVFLTKKLSRSEELLHFVVPLVFYCNVHT